MPPTLASFPQDVQDKRLRSVWRELPFTPDGPCAFRALFGAAPAAFWLDSSRAGHPGARWSFMGDAGGPLASVVSWNAGTGQLSQLAGAAMPAAAGDLFAYLKASLRPPVEPPPLPFIGGHVGWIGYECQSLCGSTIARSAATPDALFIRADRLVAIDHHAGRSYVAAQALPGEEPAATAWVNGVAGRLEDLPPVEPLRDARARAPIDFRLDRDRATYLADIAQCLEWIGEGQSYQICLTNQFRCTADVDHLDLYCTLRQLNPAPFAAFIRWPGRAILSASPERFLAVDKTGRVETKPIKGTIRRGAHPQLDAALAQSLKESEKDNAENLMIVDLLRNDISRVCQIGSVEVPSLMAVESFATVHQLVSTVRGQLRPDCSAIDLIEAAFPGGSMTGVPKLHTLKLIDRLERAPRGVYSGALGWIGNDGAMDLSIVIRTIVAQGSALSIGAGGGIVADSQGEAEFEEMLLKARALVQAITLAATGRMDEGSYRIVGA